MNPVYVFCAVLTCDGIPCYFGVFLNHIVSVVILLEAFFILKSEDKLATEPVVDFSITLAIRAATALFELDDQMRGVLGVVITKDIIVLINANHVLPVVFDLLAVMLEDWVEETLTLIF